MPVYVDPARWPYRRMIMCHLYADTPEELHAMVDAINVQRKWFQKRKGFPHYDICKGKRELAIKNGAIEHTPRQMHEWAKTNKPMLCDGSIWLVNLL